MKGTRDEAVRGTREETDEALFRRMRNGDRAAFAELYDRREPALFRYAFHALGSRAAAEEVAQEVFVQLMNPSCRFDDSKGSVEAWAFGVARNLIRAMRRRGQPEETVEQAFDPDIVGSLVRDERLAALRTAVRELPENYRETVVLCDLEERNYDEAARIMNCPVGTVRSRLHRARALLAAKLRRFDSVVATAGAR